jgi:hypothetical protein
VLHLQGLEFNPELRFEALGPDFLRAVLWVLSRTDADVAVAETRAVALSLPLLWPPAEAAASSFRALTPAALRVFATALEAAGFRAFRMGGGDRVAPSVAAQLGIAASTDGMSYYRVVREDPQFDDGLGGADGQMCPATLVERDFENVGREEEEARGGEAPEAQPSDHSWPGRMGGAEDGADDDFRSP